MLSRFGYTDGVWNAPTDSGHSVIRKFQRGLRVTTKFQLVVEQGPRLGQAFPLKDSIIIIGRDPMADVSLPDPEVSRQHARMARDEQGDYKIQDLGSTNGTFINGQRLGGEAQTLRTGQVILLGSSVMLRYEHVVEAESVNAAAGIVAVAGETAVANPSLSPMVETPPKPEGAPQISALDPSPLYTSEPAAPPLASLPDEGKRPFVPAGLSEHEKQQQRTITWIIVAAALLILCCCIFSLTAWYWWGDPLMEALGLY